MARLDQTTRARVKDTFPPRRCGRPTRKGTPCIRYIVVGANVCPTHGAMAPQVRAAAEKRVTLAEALVSSPKRPPWEVLEDGLHAVDVIMRDVVVQIQDQGSVTPQLLDKLVSSVERAHRLAKVNLDAGIDQRRLKLAEAQATQMHRVFTAVLAGLHLTPNQKALVPTLLKREIEGVLVLQKEPAERQSPAILPKTA